MIEPLDDNREMLRRFAGRRMTYQAEISRQSADFSNYERLTLRILDVMVLPECLFVADHMWLTIDDGARPLLRFIGKTAQFSAEVLEYRDKQWRQKWKLCALSDIVIDGRRVPPVSAAQLP